MPFRTTVHIGEDPLSGPTAFIRVDTNDSWIIHVNNHHRGYSEPSLADDINRAIEGLTARFESELRASLENDRTITGMLAAENARRPRHSAPTTVPTDPYSTLSDRQIWEMYGIRVGTYMGTGANESQPVQWDGGADKPNNTVRSVLNRIHGGG